MEITGRRIIPGFVWRIGTGSNRSSHHAHGNSRAGGPPDCCSHRTSRSLSTLPRLAARAGPVLFLTNRPARRFLDLRVDLAAEKDRQSENVEPEHEHDHSAQAAVDRAVTPGITEIKREEE